MESLFKITKYNIDNPEDSFEVEIKGPEARDIDAIVKASKMLIESIDVKHACDEDHNLFENSIKGILLSIAEVLEAEGWEVEEDTEKARLENIVHVINNY